MTNDYCLNMQISKLSNPPDFYNITLYIYIWFVYLYYLYTYTQNRIASDLISKHLVVLWIYYIIIGYYYYYVIRTRKRVFIISLLYVYSANVYFVVLLYYKIWVVYVVFSFHLSRRRYILFILGVENDCASKIMLEFCLNCY